MPRSSATRIRWSTKQRSRMHAGIEPSAVNISRDASAGASFRASSRPARAGRPDHPPRTPAPAPATPDAPGAGAREGWARAGPASGPPGGDRVVLGGETAGGDGGDLVGGGTGRVALDTL